METFIQTICPGVVASVIAALILIWIQFRYSTAGYRVDKVREATEKITASKADTSLLRNKYRYSLGVIIDDLHQSFKDGFNERGPWPVLVDNGDECEPQVDKSGDRWDKFNRYIRPVVEDINTYSFVGLLQLSSSLRQLRLLTILCHKLEDAVSETDAAFGNGLICNKDNRTFIRQDVTADVEDLRNAYYELYIAWCNWYQDNKDEVNFRKAHKF
jgi:hypothetical protein